MTIPKIIHQIWVGPLPPPEAWMRTWREKNPMWEYRLWTNEDLKSREWLNKKHIRAYAKRGLWNGVADLMRYEILYFIGGIVVAADSECINPIDELFEDGFKLYTVSTSNLTGYDVNPANEGSTTPLYAAAPRQEFTRRLVLDLRDEHNRLLPNPVRATGNRYMQRQIKRYAPEIKIWPIHYFISDHFNGWKYDGPDKIYARHFWGTTRGTYAQGVDDPATLEGKIVVK